jgi:ADP-ribosylglycohydrolase
MTIAVAEALRLSDSPDHFSELLPKKMREWGRKYPRAGYGGRFAQWLSDESMGAYGSYGNGSGMRVSPCGLAAASLEEALELAKRSAEVTHDHPEGIKGAQAIAACVYLAGTGESKDSIRTYVEENFYELKQTIDEIRPHYTMDISCQGSVPVAIEAFLEGENFEDVIRTAISVGGDSDTIAAMAGSIGWSYYKAQNGGNLTCDMEYMKTKVEERMPDDIKMAIADFYAYCEKRQRK